MWRDAVRRHRPHARRLNQYGPGPLPLRSGETENPFGRTNKPMKEIQDISQVIRQLHTPASANLDQRVYGEITKAAAVPASGPPPPEVHLPKNFRQFLNKKTTR